MANPNPLPPPEEHRWKPGQSGNPKGKPKGAKHLSTWIQELLNDEEFEARLLDAKVGYKDYKGAPIKAIIGVAITKAVNGDTRWAEWLAKHGYGTNLNIEGELTIKQSLVQFIGEDGQNNNPDTD